MFFFSCHCERYVSVEELCNSSCMSTLPVLSARLDTEGQLLLRIKATDESKTWSRVSSGLYQLFVLERGFIINMYRLL